MTYVAGRSWIEYLRVDHANHILGLRLNDWTSIVVFLFALITFIVSAKRRPGRETVVEFKNIRADAVGAAGTIDLPAVQTEGDLPPATVHEGDPDPTASEDRAAT